VIGDPATVRPRTDLTFLRHRSRPAVAAAAPSRSDDEIRRAIADFVAGRGQHPARGPRRRAAAAPAPATSPISFARPGRDRPVAPAPAPPIRFDRPSRSAPAQPAVPAPHPPAVPAPHPPAVPAQPSGSLDLSDPVATPTPAARRLPVRPSVRPPAGARVRPGQQHLLSVHEPTVLLGRLQSGIGLLDIEAVVSADVGDLRLGAAYQLRSGHTSTVQMAANGNRFAPSSRRPVLVSGRDEYDHVRVDLRQVRELERMAVYAFSESRTTLTWGGTLVVTTSGGARIDLPLEGLYAGSVAVLLTVYNVDGRLVVRAEMETVAGDVREAARAYGYDRITWRDDRTPVD
jgi:uncharacterized protein involved in tellurium resistance